ncbi:hypothetical protein V8F20_004294 [Naviculisporaceae sp. PSN 640]
MQDVTTPVHIPYCTTFCGFVLIGPSKLRYPVNRANGPYVGAGKLSLLQNYDDGPFLLFLRIVVYMDIHICQCPGKRKMLRGRYHLIIHLPIENPATVRNSFILLSLSPRFVYWPLWHRITGYNTTGNTNSGLGAAFWACSDHIQVSIFCPLCFQPHCCTPSYLFNYFSLSFNACYRSKGPGLVHLVSVEQQLTGKDAGDILQVPLQP